MSRIRVFLDDRKLRKLEKKLSRLTAKKVKVGIVEDSTHSSGISMAELAAIHQFGAPGAGIPARDFLRAPIQDRKAEQIRVTAAVAKAIVAGAMSIDRGLDIIGIWGEATVKAAIRDGISPANRPATIAAKGSSTPLIDTGELHDAISHKVT